MSACSRSHRNELKASHPTKRRCSTPSRRTVFWTTWLVIVSGAMACAGSTRGVPVETPPARSELYARAMVRQLDGLRVLLNGQTTGSDFSTKAWVASDEVELVALWHGVRPGGTPPDVDFTRYVVFGLASQGGVCPATVTGIHAETSGLLALEYDMDTLLRTCTLQAVRTALVVAVPRRVLPGPVVQLWAHEFTLDEPLVPLAN